MKTLTITIALIVTLWFTASAQTPSPDSLLQNPQISVLKKGQRVPYDTTVTMSVETYRAIYNQSALADSLIEAQNIAISALKAFIAVDSTIIDNRDSALYFCTLQNTTIVSDLTAFKIKLVNKLYDMDKKAVKDKRKHTLQGIIFGVGMALTASLILTR